MDQNLPVHKAARVLVVGTTSDYIDWIRKACPGRALFLTDTGIRENACEDAPLREEEIITFLEDIAQVRMALASHLKLWGYKISGVACFDCESMELASVLASDLDLTYPDIQTIRNCRDKILSKQIWEKNNIECPKSCPVNFLDDINGFFLQTQNGIVLKPIFGSGSELVFRCRTEKECQEAFLTIRSGLEQRASNLLFKKSSSCDQLMVAEEMIQGPEFSCDFILEDNRIFIIRITRKLKPNNRPFGTITGYVIPSVLPAQVDLLKFEQTLLKGATTLGISRGICMVDFILRDSQPILIEMTPRPGGDCLPSLLLAAGNLDILRLTLDFAEKKPLDIDPKVLFKPHVGIRIHANKSGILKRIDSKLLENEHRVKKMNFIRKPGHVITMPPNDYDSWLLGHMIIQTDKSNYQETQCLLIAKRLIVEIE